MGWQNPTYLTPWLMQYYNIIKVEDGIPKAVQCKLCEKKYDLAGIKHPHLEKGTKRLVMHVEGVHGASMPPIIPLNTRFKTRTTVKPPKPSGLLE